MTAGTERSEALRVTPEDRARAREIRAVWAEAVKAAGGYVTTDADMWNHWSYERSRAGWLAVADHLAALLARVREEQGADAERPADARRCAECAEPLVGKFYGAGRGDGDRFMCPECYWRDRAHAYEMDMLDAREEARRYHDALVEIEEHAKQGAEGVMRLYHLNKIEAKARAARLRAAGAPPETPDA